MCISFCWDHFCRNITERGWICMDFWSFSTCSECGKPKNKPFPIYNKSTDSINIHARGLWLIRLHNRQKKRKLSIEDGRFGITAVYTAIYIYTVYMCTYYIYIYIYIYMYIYICLGTYVCTYMYNIYIQISHFSFHFARQSSRLHALECLQCGAITGSCQTS